MGTRLQASKSRVMSTRVKLQLKHSRLRCCFCSVSSWEDSYQRWHLGWSLREGEDSQEWAEGIARATAQKWESTAWSQNSRESWVWSQWFSIRMFGSEQQTISSPFIQKKPQSREHLNSPMWRLHDLSSDPCFFLLCFAPSSHRACLGHPPRPPTPQSQEPSTDTTVSRRGWGLILHTNVYWLAKKLFPEAL